MFFKKNTLLFFFAHLLIITCLSFANSIENNSILLIPSELHSKMGSCYLHEQLDSKLNAQNNGISGLMAGSSNDFMNVVIYFKHQPSTAQVDKLEHFCTLYSKKWTAPLQNHPLGFLVARIAASKVFDLMALDFVQKVDTADLIYKTQSNSAAHVVEADVCWQNGYDGCNGGSTVNIAILDAGLDVGHPDLPTPIVAKDYSYYPTIDDDIRTYVSGHGTHVTGIALGRGVLSANNQANGGGAYKGMAPGANLIFLKIGKDSDASASSTAMYYALVDAAGVYGADVINLSYGSWHSYHDGSYYVDQKIDDIVYNSNIPVIVGAGNYGSSKRHYSETVAGQSSSGYIQVDVNSAPANYIKLRFNVVWYDGVGKNNSITIEYYDNNKNLLPSGDVRYYGQTESTVGTEHQVSYYNPYLPAGNGTYYLKIVNNSNESQFVHIYEDYDKGYVSFNNADPYYTVSSPASASNAFAVGACGNRDNYVDYLGNSHGSYNYEVIASYSGRGPRVDEQQKPQLSAPGQSIISIRDRNVYTSPSASWIDNNGQNYGDPNDANYLVMSGTSMATPVVTGSAALILDEHPDYTAQEVYDALQTNANANGGIVPPDAAWGYGVLDLDEDDSPSNPISVTLSSFEVTAQDGVVFIEWATQSQNNHAGFNILRSNECEGEYRKINDFLIYKSDDAQSQEISYSFIDDNLSCGEYFYKLEEISLDGRSTCYGPKSALLITDVASNSARPLTFGLSKNYPNPFNPTTTLNFQLAHQEHVRIIVRDLLGREITTLVEEDKGAGNYSIVWDGTDSNGNELSSGMYLVQMIAGTFSKHQKVTLIR